ncbi:hypothetical protein ACTOV4_10180 [Brucella sp. C7-11G]
MTIKIENIRPDYDEDEGHDILKFTVNGETRSEYLTGKFPGREEDDFDGLFTLYRLDIDYSKEDRNEIRAHLADWIAANKDERFARKSDNPDVESIEHGLNVSHGDIVVWLTNDAAERLNLDDTAYEVTSDGSISWRDRDFGDQYYENAVGGDQENSTRRINLSNPESCIYDIEHSLKFGYLAQLREEVGAEDENTLTI